MLSKKLLCGLVMSFIVFGGCNLEDLNKANEKCCGEHETLSSSTTELPGPRDGAGEVVDPVPADVVMIAEYDGKILASGRKEVDVSEIIGKGNTVYLKIYWSPDRLLWVQMTDGWLPDNDYDHSYRFSCDFGKVLLIGMHTHDYFLIQVFERN